MKREGFSYGFSIFYKVKRQNIRNCILMSFL